MINQQINLFYMLSKSFPFFGQDSMLEFDGQALDPAIVSAQPMKSAQMVCAPGKKGNLHVLLNCK